MCAVYSALSSVPSDSRPAWGSELDGSFTPPRCTSPALVRSGEKTLAMTRNAATKITSVTSLLSRDGDFSMRCLSAHSQPEMSGFGQAAGFPDLAGCFKQRFAYHARSTRLGSPFKPHRDDPIV